MVQGSEQAAAGGFVALHNLKQADQSCHDAMNGCDPRGN